jgi:methylated-DNA-[protein]-cysteine S-methyltransferase
MSDHGRALFETAIGWCGLAWGPGGLTGVLLPEASREATRERLARRYPDAPETEPSAEAKAAIEAMTALLAGEAADLSFIRLDLDRVGAFEKQVYAIARAIPPGSTLTYGEIATRLGDRLLARAVGQALGANPWPIVMPCHRVLAADGKVGGFSAPGGLQTKARMLSIERANVGGAPGLFDDLPFSVKPRRPG